MNHKYLYLQQSPSDPLPIVLGSEEEKPKYEDFVHHKSGVLWKDVLYLWLSRCVKYKIADGHLEEFEGIADKIGFETMTGNTFQDDLKEGILLPSESVKIKAVGYHSLSEVPYEHFAFFVDKAKERFKYTLEDMKRCFNESRLTHPMLGFKHKDFDEYNQLNK